MDELIDPLLDRDGRVEPELVDLLVGDLVVPLVLVLADLGEVEVEVDLFFQEVADLLLAVVHLVVACVEDLVAHLVQVVDGEEKAAGDVEDVDEGPLEGLLVDDEVALLDGLVSEVVDEEVEPHPRRDAEGRGEAVTDDVPGLQEKPLRLGLGLAVNGEGVQGCFLGADFADDGPVVAPGGRVDDRLVFAPVLQDGKRPPDVGLFGQLRVLLACRVPDDGGQVEDEVGVFEGLFHELPVQDVAPDELEVGMQEARHQGVTAEHEVVDHSDLVALLKSLRNEGRPHITRAASHQDGLACTHVILLKICSSGSEFNRDFCRFLMQPIFNTISREHKIRDYIEKFKMY